MCSRYNLTTPHEAVRATFAHVNELPFPPRYNIAPTQPVVILRHDQQRRRELSLVRWGLLPPWVKNPGEFATLINARAETALDKPSFRGAMRHRRCVVPADGFYEWTGKPGHKRPHHIHPRAPGVMALAGLWEYWLGADGSELETMAILTVAANGTVAEVHDRMPAILAAHQIDDWLDTRRVSATDAHQLLHPAAIDLLEITSLTDKINNSRLEGPQLLEVENKTLL
jgi:putative SOS response-associated peptidase YedK